MFTIKLISQNINHLIINIFKTTSKKWITITKNNNNKDFKLLHHKIKTEWLTYFLALLEEWFIQVCTTVEWDQVQCQLTNQHLKFMVNSKENKLLLLNSKDLPDKLFSCKKIMPDSIKITLPQSIPLIKENQLLITLTILLKIEKMKLNNLRLQILERMLKLLLLTETLLLFNKRFNKLILLTLILVTGTPN